VKQPVVLGSIVTLLIAVPVMANDLVFVGLPAARAEFAASAGEIQLAVSAFVLTFAAVQLFYGPLSDQFGRRPVLLATLGAFVIATGLSAVAVNLEMLVAARVLQAVGAGAGPALGRAILRDRYGAERSIPILSYIMSCFGVVAMAAPLIGGGLTDVFGWRAVFVFAMIYGSVCFLLVLFLLEESAPPKDHGTGALHRVFRSYSILLTSRNYVLLGLCNSLVYSAMFTWLAGLAFVLIGAFGLNATSAGLWFGVSVSGFIIGSALAGRMTKTILPLQTVLLGAVICLIASVVGSLLAIYGNIGVMGLVVTGFFMMTGIGFAIPPATGAGIAPFPEMAGAASSLVGFTQGGLSSLAVLAVGFLYDGTARPMLLLMTGLTVAGLLFFIPLLKHLKTRVLPRH
jgi:DHA1 family bicyclomycin/chloramphenicol resistance-like MFS transporter